MNLCLFSANQNIINIKLLPNGIQHSLGYIDFILNTDVTSSYVKSNGWFRMWSEIPNISTLETFNSGVSGKRGFTVVLTF